MEELDSALKAELEGELEIVRLLGQGSTARVYLAREPALQRLVAVKVLREELANDEIGRRRFEREAQSAARISHPHVTQVYRVGRLASDVPFTVMEYIDGRPLKDVIKARGPLDHRRAREVLVAMASALVATHQRGIVHRDVQPGNVFIENRTERAVLGDFGIAALIETGTAAAARLTGAGVRLGDIRYMSPEQILGEAVTEQTDMYAFGILAYEALTGEGPYDARTDAQLMAAHLSGEPRPLASLLPDVEPLMARIVERCLARDPNERPRAEEVVDLLRTRVDTPATTPATPGGVEAEIDDGPIAAFLGELRRRRVYQVLVAYGAFAVAILGGAQTVYDAFQLSERSYQILVSSVLAGFPVALALSWAYDFTSTGIRRTESDASSRSRRTTALKWGAFALSVAIVVVLGWWMLV